MPTRDEPVYIRVEKNEHILGTLLSPGTLIPGVLFVHGWGADQNQYLGRARELAAHGCVCLTFDLRGHAQTQKLYDIVSREESMRDILAAYDFLAAQSSVDSDSIAVVGSSYGGYLAALLTALRPVKWLALRAPALYKDSEWALPKSRLKLEQGLEAYRRQPVRPDESRALRACLAFTGDVLIVESEHDSLVPHQVVANYREAFISAKSTTYRVIPGADHALSDEAWQRAYSTALVTWLSEMVLGARSPEPAAPAPPPKPSPAIQPPAARPTAAETDAGNNAVAEPLERRQ
jgi:pimeloyl-ACP methyl ester carboxylesterase